MSLAALIVAAHRELPAEIRSAPATADELAGFEAEFGPIPAEYRWYLEQCGGGVAGAEWLDDVRKLAQSHRKFLAESGPDGWRMQNVFIIGWDGAGNPMAIDKSSGAIVVEDHNFGGIHVMAPSLLVFLAEGLGISAPAP